MITTLTDKSYEFSFYQAVLLLEKHYQLEPNSNFVAVGENKYFHQERIEFSVSPSLAFPKSDMEFITHMERNGQQYSPHISSYGMERSSSRSLSSDFPLIQPNWPPTHPSAQQ